MSRFVIFFVCFAFQLFECAAQSSWHVLPNIGLGIDSSRFQDVYFVNKETGFAVNRNGWMYKTNDGGNSWEVKYNPATVSILFRSIEFLNDGSTGIVGSVASGKLLRSTDSGNTWIDISHHLSDTGFSPRSVCGLSRFGHTFYGVGWYGGDIARFYKSIDKGVTWQTSYLDTNLDTQLVDVVFLSQDTGFASGGVLLRNPTRRASVILKTMDGGLSWSRVFMDTTVGGRIWKLQVINEGGFVGSVEGYYTQEVCMVKSVDRGENWNLIRTGVNKQLATQGIGFRTENEGWIGGDYSGLVRTKDGGQSWDTINFGIRFNRFFIVDSNCTYAGGISIYRYGDSLALGVSTPQVPKQLHTLFPVTPNPAKGVVKLEFELKTAANVLLDVASLDARKSIVIAKARLSPGRHTYYWDSSDAAPGMYMVWLDTDEQAQIQKFLLLK